MAQNSSSSQTARVFKHY